MLNNYLVMVIWYSCMCNHVSMFNPLVCYCIWVFEASLICFILKMCCPLVHLLTWKVTTSRWMMAGTWLNCSIFHLCCIYKVTSRLVGIPIGGLTPDFLIWHPWKNPYPLDGCRYSTGYRYGWPLTHLRVYPCSCLLNPHSVNLMCISMPTLRRLWMVAWAPQDIHDYHEWH